MDIEKFSNLSLDQDSVKSITKACNEMKQLENEIENDEEVLANKKKKIKRLCRKKSA